MTSALFFLSVNRLFNNPKFPQTASVVVWVVGTSGYTSVFFNPTTVYMQVETRIFVCSFFANKCRLHVDLIS